MSLFTIWLIGLFLSIVIMPLVMFSCWKEDGYMTGAEFLGYGGSMLFIACIPGLNLLAAVFLAIVLLADYGEESNDSNWFTDRHVYQSPSEVFKKITKK